MSGISILDFAENNRASEIYVKAKFYDDCAYWIPISGHRFDFEFSKSDTAAIMIYLQSISEYFVPANITKWYSNLEAMYSKDLSARQLAFLKEMASPNGVCRYCSEVYNESPNPQATIRELKDKGFYICTVSNYCDKAKRLKTYDYLTPIPPHTISKRTENIPQETRNQVKRIFNYKDSYTGSTDHSVLPDHKFPEIRWGVTPDISDNVGLSDEEAQRKFQPLTNRFNLLKKEACKKCFSENKRQFPYGIKFYYQGGEDWDEAIPKQGPGAEAGCVGCGWYDLLKWKEALNKELNNK